MNDCEPLKADAQSPKVVQLSQGSLYDPAGRESAGWLRPREQLCDVVAVGSGGDHRKRDTLCFDDEKILGVWASAISGIRLCL